MKQLVKPIIANSYNINICNGDSRFGNTTLQSLFLSTLKEYLYDAGGQSLLDALILVWLIYSVLEMNANTTTAVTWFSLYIIYMNGASLFH